MKEYYEILDVPVTATPEEIKAQYRQMVRIYHPDRFRNQDDKAYAEERLKEINIAFQVLSGSSVRRQPFEARVAPQPVAYPPQLNFGTLMVGQRAVRNVQIGNLGGPAEQVTFAYSCEKPWFQLAKGKRVYAQQPFPLDFEVMVDTRRLQPDQQYAEWLEVILDGMPIRVQLQVNTVARRRTLSPMRLGWLATALVLMVALLLALPMLRITDSILPLPGALLSARPTYELHSAEMLFSVSERDQSTLYASLGAGSTPRRLELEGEQAVGTQSGQKIAYLGGQEANKEIYLLDLASGQTHQITQNRAAKRMLEWAPDGLRLGYLVGDANARRIGIYDLRSGQEYLLPSEVAAGVEHFAWSPDGQSLLFDLWEGAEQRVYRMGVHGNDLRQLTHFDSWAGAWSADGTKILVGAQDGLYMLSSRGQQLQQLTNVPTRSFRWSADGEWITYTTAAASTAATVDRSTVSTADSAGEETLWLINRNGGAKQQIATNSLWHQWSPAGAALGYVTGKAGTAEPLLYLWTVTPTTTPALVAEVNEPFFAWPR